MTTAHSPRRKILVAMSGGVDSSVVAALLQKEGHDVVGCFMRLGSPGESLEELIPAESCDLNQPAQSPSRVKIGHQGCCSINDAADARQVAATLGIPLYVCNFKKDFSRVIDYFVDEYANGRTPNPCVRCNDWLKFGKLHEYAKQIGADCVASGHYARIEQRGGEYRLLRGRDSTKDQSYVLFGAPPERLSSMLFPIGDLPKTQVRELAREFNLPVFDKPDSQEICFVPDNDYAGLVTRRRPELAQEGLVVDEAGQQLGTHQGHHQFTLGQRRGLSISLGHPIYVVGKDSKTNTVTVGTRESLMCSHCNVSESNWFVAPPRYGERREVWAKFRYNSPPSLAWVSVLSDTPNQTPSGRAGRFEIEFQSPQTAVAPGQALVMYDAEDQDVVVGGGWIEASQRTSRAASVD